LTRRAICQNRRIRDFDSGDFPENRFRDNRAGDFPELDFMRQIKAGGVHEPPQ
jgi:hypothetical protein